MNKTNNMRRKCTNSAFCERFKYLSGKEMMRCWQEPCVCDHPFVQTIEDGEKGACYEHRFQEERDTELFEKAKLDYNSHFSTIKDLEEKYPSLKNTCYKLINKECYLVRDKFGYLYLVIGEKPIFSEDGQHLLLTQMCNSITCLCPEWYPKIKYEDGPIKIDLIVEGKINNKYKIF